MMRLLLAFLALIAAPLHAEVRQATPETLTAILEAAQSGDTVNLGRRSYGDVTLPRRDHAEPVTIDASVARISTLMIRKTAGWIWLGGIIDPNDRSRHAVIIDAAKRITLAGAWIEDGMTGVTVTRGSEDITLRGNVTTAMLKDGFDVNDSNRVSLIGNTCRDFAPIMPVYRNGVKVIDGTHNDCIQLWATEGMTLSNVLISGNWARGYMQGIGQYKSWGRTVGVEVRDNTLELVTWNGISFFSKAEGVIVQNNRVRTLPNTTQDGKPARARIVLREDAVRCGNVVDGHLSDGSC